ncbi:prepilin-type N-terminal cleavage/methylation domain-containing protein [Alkalibacillus silvisoli]|uniref:Prepilin-type N-terminal cleavage/methylation domain-containing protein n=1 Tax=Alkalibacillus silvisoli TaxID=392823 RepID=A0ABP3JDQ2_9BACI
MVNKYYSDESGVTLIEVLASLVLVSIISILAFNVLTNTFQYSETSISHADLRQDSNFIITQIRQKHQEEIGDYALCKEDLQRIQQYEVNLEINEIPIHECKTFSYKDPLNVNFTMKNQQDHEYQINTTIEPKVERERVKDIQLSLPSHVDDFYSYLSDEKVFIYSGNISVNGSASISGDRDGQMIINNNETDLNFSTANHISVNTIYIDKEGQEVNFPTSTSLGEAGVTELVNIKGDVYLNNGGATVNGEHVFIDGNVTFNSSSVINASSVHISGDVTFNNWAGDINAEQIYIGGDITSDNPDHNNIKTGEFDEEQLPDHPNIHIPSLKEEQWFYQNDYENTLTLDDDSKIFSPSDLNIHVGNNNPENFIIVSKGNVSIDSNWSELDGVIIAPNGKVTFYGDTFTGVVISKEGLDVVNGGSSVYFKNIEQYMDSDESPFE